MQTLGHVLTATVLALVFRWLWRSSAVEKAREESGSKIFPPTRAIRALAGVMGTIMISLVVLVSILARKPEDWWAPYLFLAFLLVVPFMIPPVLTINVDGVESRIWYSGGKKIRWEDIASLHYNAGNKQFTVRASDGRKITHAGFNADPYIFQQEIQRRTRLPMKITRPGTWKTETIELPYDKPAVMEPELAQKS